MIADLLPTNIVGVEAPAHQWKTELLPKERLLAAGLAEGRRREFAAGRNCARQALGRLGWPDFPLLSGDNHEPLWPPGLVGSISHCKDYCAVIVARVADLDQIQGLGLDVELKSDVPADVLDGICTVEERGRLLDGFASRSPALVFSAKESVYKAWFPIAHRWLAYRDVELAFDMAPDRFAVHLLPSAPEDSLPGTITMIGRFKETATHVFTVVMASLTPSRLTDCLTANLELGRDGASKALA